MDTHRCRSASYKRTMSRSDLKTALLHTYRSIDSNHLFQMAAALSYYFVFSIFPGLILLSVAITYLPLSNTLQQAVYDISRLLPGDEVQVIGHMITQVVTPHRGTLLSLGLLGMLWTASSGFAASMEALNITYGAQETRPFWKTRPLALALTFSVGVMFFVVTSIMTVGPHISHWFFGGTVFATYFPNIWPYLHWFIAVAFTVLEVEMLYYIAPDVKQSFRSTLPGATVAVVAWIALMYGMGVYFRSFANFNLEYGVLGAGVAIMMWLYWAGFALLIGAQLNFELEKMRATPTIAVPKPIIPATTGPAITPDAPASPEVGSATTPDTPVSPEGSEQRRVS